MADEEEEKEDAGREQGTVMSRLLLVSSLAACDVRLMEPGQVEAVVRDILTLDGGSPPSSHRPPLTPALRPPTNCLTSDAVASSPAAATAYKRGERGKVQVSENLSILLCSI